MRENSLTCPEHGVALVTFCPACRGSHTSARKKVSSKINGRLGGRPPILYTRGRLTLTVKQWARRWRVTPATAWARLRRERSLSEARP